MPSIRSESFRTTRSIPTLAMLWIRNARATIPVKIVSQVVSVEDI
jgi:hypothetical protein